MGVIEINDVSKRFRLYKDRPGSVKEVFTKIGKKRYEDFWALRDVSLEVEEGSVYGLIGHNGCGKSTLLRVMAGIHTPTSGSVRTHGRISALLELGAGFHPELTGRENIYLNASILGLSRKETDRLFDQIVAFSGLEPFIDSPVKHYSSGMFVRLGFSVAVHVDPQILLIDEVIAVGDEDFQRRCLEHLASLKAQGVTIVLVTHSMGIVQNMCDHVTWMDHGRVRSQGDPLEVTSEYLREVNAGEALRHRDEATSGIDKSGPFLFDGVKLVDSGGTAAPFALSGSAVAFRIHWRSKTVAPPPIVTLGIETESGVHLATARIDTGDLGIGSAPGRYTIDYVFDRLPLAPGNYHLELSAHTAGNTVELDRLSSIPMVVRSDGYLIEGLFDLRGQWAKA